MYHLLVKNVIQKLEDGQIPMSVFTKTLFSLWACQMRNERYDAKSFSMFYLIQISRKEIPLYMDDVLDDLIQQPALKHYRLTENFPELTHYL